MTRFERIIDGKYKFQTYHVRFKKTLNMSNLWKLIRRPHKIVILCFAELKEKRQIILLSLSLRRTNIQVVQHRLKKNKKKKKKSWGGGFRNLLPRRVGHLKKEKIMLQ